MPVKFIGSIILCIPSGDNRKFTAETIFELNDAHYVPVLCATLLSTEAMFQKQGIRTAHTSTTSFVLWFRAIITSKSAKLPPTTPSRSRLMRAIVCAMANEIDTVERARGQAG
eukprot:2650602-Pleurochrysis_carterae.AAC.1